MESLKELYKLGNGPSSSHTMGPSKAAFEFLQDNSDADSFLVTLYGSLAKTGKGHLTDKAISDVLGERCEIIFDIEKTDLVHQNTMVFQGYKDNHLVSKQTYYSVGGGKIVKEREVLDSALQIYPFEDFNAIKKYCIDKNISLWQFVLNFESEDIFEHLKTIKNAMFSSIEQGLVADGVLPGSLELPRKAKILYNSVDHTADIKINYRRLLCSYAYAASEHSAGGGLVVTAPTCGACGVLPAVLYYIKIRDNLADEEIIRALAVAGVIGNVVKSNASISGAQCGCQAEIGTATSMASAAAAYLMGMDIEKIEYAAEVAMEHQLGLTCDPIDGLVQIPCIERNAVAALRAIDSAVISEFLSDLGKISFDAVVKTMYETGLDLFSKYKETSEGGLAKVYRE